MDVDVLLVEFFGGQSRHVGMSLDILECDGGRFLHHVAEISGHRKLALSFAYGTLHEENFSTHLGPRESCDDSHSLIALLLVVE